jgi:hypothetical protein
MLLAALSSTVLADKEKVNDQYSVTSPNGKYIIELIPSANFGEAGKGFAFAVEDTHRRDTLWSVDWFAKKVFLADDGSHLVRLGPWAKDKKGLTDKAIGFYNKGKVVKQYLVKDLVKDKKSISATVSHYTWETCDSAIVSGLSKDFKTYTLVTTDRIIYVFNTSSGKIIKKKVLGPAEKRIMPVKKDVVKEQVK